MYVQGRVYNIRKMTQSAFSLDMNVVFNLHFILKFNIQKFWKGTQRKLKVRGWKNFCLKQ